MSSTLLPEQRINRYRKRKNLERNPEEIKQEGGTGEKEEKENNS
jgi:hypothetical protein